MSSEERARPGSWRVEGMGCESCVASLQEALDRGLPGGGAVAELGRLRLSREVPRAALETAVRGAGFKLGEGPSPG